MRRLALVLALSLCGAAASAQTSSWPSEGPPGPLPTHDVKFPPYEIRKLPNGLQVVVVLQHEEPAVSMRLLIRAGSASDPKAKLGVAHLAASLLDQGTTTKSAQAIADTIDFIGGAEETGAGTDLSFLNMIVMKDSFDLGMRMLSDMTRHPAFAPAEIDRQRAQMLSGMEVSDQDPSWVANAVFDRLVYGFHPYGLPDTGTRETIAAIARDDLVAFHDAYFAPNNAILAIVGDVTAQEAFDEATAVFGDWAAHPIPKQTYIAPPDPTRRVIVVDKPDAVQTEVRVGNLGVPRNSPDYMALNLAIRILGGEGANRLHQVLRTERGLTYGAEADMDTLKESGDFEAQTNTRSAATAEVLRLIVNEFWRLQRERVSNRELEDAKAYMTGSFPLTIETPDQIALQVLNVVFYDLPVQELQTFRDRVNVVTPDDIERVARVYLKPDRLSVVLVGNAAAFEPDLKGAGFGRFETVELKDLDLTSADFRVPKVAHGAGGAASASLRLLMDRTAAYQHASQQSTGTPVAPREGGDATALLDRAIAAKGGLATLRGIRGIKAVTTGTMTTPTGGSVEAQVTTWLQYPDHVRVETKLPSTTIVQGYDGEHAWVKDPMGLHDVPQSATGEIRATFQRDTIAALLAAHDGTLKARALPDVKDPSGALYHALELSGPTFDPMVMYIDPATGYVVRQTYVAAGPGRPLIEEHFGDYRPVDGVEVAFTASVQVGGRQILERKVTDIQVNPPIAASLFKRPAS
ncbi:MAG: insulinase family protein [Betaproteobacteria bacterium]